MTDNNLQKRHKQYFQLSSDIAYLDNTHLPTPVATSDTATGWGSNQLITISDTPVFVKRIPVTDIEYNHMFSTQNLYNLPTFYQYGFGSVGLGVFRELGTHIKTTNWVLAGEIENFPLLYHYRILPSSKTPVEVDMAYHTRYVNYWGGNANISRYMLDRANAPYELVLYFEHFPYSAADWLLDHPSKIPTIMSDLHTAVSFLREHSIIHFDTHFANVLTDGTHAYLTDFGLALDKQFTLTSTEMQFYQQHTEYDYGNLLWSLGAHLYRIYCELSEVEKKRIADTYHINNQRAIEDLLTLLLTYIQELASSGMIALDQEFIALIVKFRPVINFMHDFYTAMRHTNRKDIPFLQITLQQLLKQTGYVQDLALNHR